MIKNGYALATKFHGSFLRIKRPNLIIVFSNRDPLIRSLSCNRWKIFIITEDGLTLNHEEGMWKKQLDDHTVIANKKKTVLEKNPCKYITLNKKCFITYD